MEGMADYLMKTGLRNSFLDQRELHDNPRLLWKPLTRAIINPLSLENKILYENLKPILD
jgi:hypothetical protein